jgi:hypothetical protein
MNTSLFINAVFAQDTLFSGKRNKVGFVTGVGFQYIGQLTGSDSRSLALNTTYYYQLRFYQLQYYRTLSRKKTFGIDVLFQPQYNTVKYKQFDTVTNYLQGHELGLNIGLLVRKNTISDQWSFYLCLSSGPHYTSGTPHRQANGFLFSNNLFAGVNVKIYKGLYADVRTGIRHISNAKFRKPNGGINDLTVNQGVMMLF